jgi:hypothetical protein
MSDTPQLLLAHHLKALKLPTFLREYDKLAQQCAAEGVDLGLRLPRFGGRFVGLRSTSWSWWPACRLRRLLASDIPGLNAAALDYTNPQYS